MLALTLFYCYDISFDLPFEQNLAANMYIALTERGIVNYGEQNFILVFYDLIGYDLGNFTLDVSGFTFYMMDMIISDMQNPKLSGFFNPYAQDVSVDFSDLRLVLSFSFYIIQRSYPYVQDGGVGSIDMTLDYLVFAMSGLNSEECPGELNVYASESIARMGRISINLESQIGYLLNAIMPFLEEYITEQFNNVIGKTFAYFLTDQVNLFLNTENPIAALEGNSTLIQDQRWIGDPLIYDRQFSVATSGLSCLLDHDTKICHKGKDYQQFERRKYIMNVDVSYELSKNVFSSAYYFLWDLYADQLRADLGVDYLEIEVVEIVRTGILQRIAYNSHGESHTIDVLGALRAKEHMQASDDTFGMVWFRPGLDRVVSSTDSDSEFVQRTVQYLDVLLNEFAFTVANSNTVDLEHVTVVYYDSNWVFVGANILV